MIAMVGMSIFVIAGRCKEPVLLDMTRTVDNSPSLKAMADTFCLRLCLQGPDDCGGSVPDHVAAAARPQVSALKQCLASVRHLPMGCAHVPCCITRYTRTTDTAYNVFPCTSPAEELSCVCRDIKSSNIMLTRAKGHRIVKVSWPVWLAILQQC